MLAFAYDSGLRREELCSLEVGDVDPAYRLLRIRAQTTKSRQERVAPYSEATSLLLSTYLQHRRNLSRERGRVTYPSRVATARGPYPFGPGRK